MKGYSPLYSVGDEKERLQLLKKVVDKLPKPNADNLKYDKKMIFFVDMSDNDMSLPIRFLVAFLQEFSLYSDLTKMNTNNIAIVIGPNLLWPREENADPA